MSGRSPGSTFSKGKCLSARREGINRRRRELNTTRVSLSSPGKKCWNMSLKDMRSFQHPKRDAGGRDSMKQRGIRSLRSVSECARHVREKGTSRPHQAGDSLQASRVAGRGKLSGNTRPLGEGENSIPGRGRGGTFSLHNYEEGERGKMTWREFLLLRF